MAYADVVLADSPLIYYKYDQTSGNLTNSGSLGGTATVYANVTRNQPGIPGDPTGKSYSFNGTTTSYTSQSLASANYKTDGTWSLELWVKIPSKMSQSLIYHLNSGWWFSTDSTGTPYVGGGGLTGLTDAGVSIVDNQWHHVVLSVAPGDVKLYVDGVLRRTIAQTLTVSTVTTSLYTSDPSDSSGTYTLNGQLDEVAIYPNALTAERVTAHYVAGSGNVTNAAPPMVVNLTTPNVTPTVTSVLNQTLAPTADWDLGNAGGGTSTIATINSSEDGAVFKFAPSIPTGYQIATATLTLTRSGASTSTNYATRVIYTPWLEASGTVPGNNSPDYYSTSKDTGTIAVGAAFSTFTVNVTEALKADEGNGFAVIGTSGGSAQIALKENATSAYRPSLNVILEAIPAVPITVEVPAMSLSVTAPNVTPKTGNKQSVPASTLSITAPAPAVTTVKNRTVAAPPMVVNLTFPGGESSNPDYLAFVDPIEAWIFAPNANGFGGSDASNDVPAIELDVTTPDVTVDLVTHRKAFVPPMSLTLNMVGMYNADEDRYHNILPTTLDADDIWYKMEETSGTAAIDFLTNDDPTRYTENGVYIGSPTLQAEGPELRKAVSFDGVDDALFVPGPLLSDTYRQMDLTVEFSVKTTDLNGVLLQGSRSEVRLVNGEIVLWTGAPYNLTYRVRKFVADGEWHHVVISIPSMSSFLFSTANISSSRQYFVMIDGQVEWARYADSSVLFGGDFTPRTVMAKATARAAFPGESGYDANSPATNTFSDHVAGSMRDFITRWHYAASSGTAARLYYEWSNSLLVQAPAMEISLSVVEPFKAKGNVKRMLAMYGLPYYLDAGTNQAVTRDGFGTYYSVFAGYHIRNDANYSPTGPGGTFEFSNANSNPVRMNFLPVKPFMLEGYLVYPLAVANTPGSTGVYSAPGIENGVNRDPITKNFVDDRTGLPRFVDLDEDLAEDVTAFDAITAVNYPAIRPDDGVENAGQSQDNLREPRQHNLGLTNSEWSAARDALRDSILNAAYRGVNLWITEPHMAQHLGFIQSYDKHETGARYEFFGSGGIDATGYTNKRGEALDAAHVDPSKNPKVAAPGLGQFNFTWQANAKRKIIATEPGLTNLPSYEMSERIRYQGDAAWSPHNDVDAWDLIDRTGGLQVGDQLVMPMWEQNEYTSAYPSFNGWSVGVPRKWIVSARPQGIVGKAISKEMDFYYGPNGMILNNPWKDNVYTIVAERGSVVRGGAIGGRAFIEFMDPDTQKVKIPEDKDKSLWNGAPGVDATTWSFDSRRYTHLVAIIILEREVQRGPTTVVILKDEQRYVEVQDPDLIFRPFMSMNARGLNWLKQTDTLDPGAAKAYVSPMEITLNAQNVTIKKTRNLVNTVTGAMRIDLDMRRVRNFETGEVREKALPMVLNLELRGTGKTITVTPIELTLSTPDVKATGDGESIYVYMDADREVTLFLKED